MSNRRLWIAVLVIFLGCLCLRSRAAEAVKEAAPAAPAAGEAPKAKAGEPAGADAPTASPKTAPKASDQEVTYFEEMAKKIQQGGWIVYVLMALSVVGIGFALERASNLRRKTVVPDGFADRAHALWQQGDHAGLASLCEKDGSALARVVRAVADHRDCAVSDVQTLAGDLGSREMRLHLQRAYPLAIIATLSPLLGLLGTVIGMIGAFDTVAAVGEMGDASILANDIAKALITTAAGLLVGIPALGLYHLFKSRTSSLAVQLEEETSEIINAWLLKPAREGAARAEAAAAPAPAGPAGKGAPDAH